MPAFDELKQFFKPSDVTIALPSDPFIVLDRDRAVEKLRIDERATQNGSRNFPPADLGGFDDIELEIVAEIGDHAKRAQIDAAANHRVYGERLSELVLLRELSTITGASARAFGDYRTTVIDRQGRLALAKDAIAESYQELADFKREHGPQRPAHRGLFPVYAWSTIIISWLLESALNTAFLGENDDAGIIGSFVAAAVIAGVNIFLSAAIGRFWWPYLFHKQPLRRALAAGGNVAWLVGLVIWNMLAGHFRDAKASGLDNPEAVALALFLNGPLSFDSIYSYGLLIAGMAFALLAATAAYKMDDPYPGYGSIYRRHEDRCEDYADEIESAMEELKDTRDDAINLAMRIRDELGQQFRERCQILAARKAHRVRFREHQDYLELVANALLGHYRAANLRARSDQQTPSHFKEKWILRRSELPPDADEPAIDAEVIRAQEALQHSIETIARAYQEAIESFEHIDAIKRSLGRG